MESGVGGQWSVVRRRATVVSCQDRGSVIVYRAFYVVIRVS